MIARRWHGRIPADKGDEYLRLMKDVGLADYRSTEGNRGAWCLHRREGHVVHVRPELVVEIALDGVQRSTRYPGGVALRFARVRRYRDDKDAGEADTIAAVQAMLPERRSAG